MSYSKLFSSIVHSSLWTEEDHVRLLFVTLLAIADREGYIYGSRMGLQRLANIIPEDHDRDPWEVLMHPDPDSSDLMRNPENEGRRIEEVPGGFRILNFLYYRSLRNDDDRREQNREAQRRFRHKVSNGKPVSSQDKPPSAEVSQNKPISDAEADTEVPIAHFATRESERKRECLEIWAAFPRKVGKPKALTAIRNALSKTTFDDLLAKTKAFALARPDKNDRFTPYPATWFNQERYNDDSSTWVVNESQPHVKPKQRAPSYPKLPPRIEQSDEDRAKAQAIAKEELEKFKRTFSA